MRHGEPNYEKDCLTQLGRVQARLAAERLLSEGISEVYSSPMGRAQQTAQAFCDMANAQAGHDQGGNVQGNRDQSGNVHGNRGHGSNARRLEIKTLDFMHEIRWGSANGDPIFADGHPWSIADEMMRLGEDLQDPGWKEHPVFFQNNLAVAESEKVATHADEWLKGFGYEREGLYYRCVDSQKAKRTIALFCHGGSSTALFAHLLNETFPYLCAAIHLDFTGITILRFDSRQGSLAMPILELVGDSRHIQP